ncbi:PH domain-containing protein [Glutamicibacter ardleyensis]
MQGENVVRIMRTHPKYLFMPALLSVLAIVAVVLTAIYIPTSYRELPARLVVFGLVFLVWLFGSTKRVFIWVSHKYVITTRQVVKLSGLIWVKSHATKIERISDVTSEQGLLDKIYGCGTLHLINASAGSREVEPQVTLYDVPRLQDVHQLIEELIEAQRRPEPAHGQWSFQQEPPQTGNESPASHREAGQGHWGVGGNRA